MPTPSERKALAFLAFVALLGGAVRILRASDLPAPTPAEDQALARQADAVDSASRQQRAKKPRKTKLSRLRRDGVADTVAGVASVPFSDVRPDRPDAARSAFVPRDGWVNGYPPPSPRIDGGNRPGTNETVATARQRGRGAPPAAAAGATVDLDRASASEMTGLPRIGAATAARIVANRDSLGPFGSLDALRRVRGMGPATLRQLAPRVTFSGRPASVNAGDRIH